MNRLFISMVLVAFAGGALLTWQATRSGTSLVFLPSELAKLSDVDSRIRIRVAGQVTTNEYNYEVQPKIVLKFRITNPGTVKGAGPEALLTKVNLTAAPDASSDLSIPVIYEGIKPDMFAAGRDVIIDGDFKDGILHAYKLLTQCPSKYEPPHATSSAAELPDKAARTY